MMPEQFQRGVALIQVLLLSAILALMALQFTLSGRHQVNIATDLQDKMTAEVLLRSQENQLLFALLTLPKTGQPELVQQNPIGKIWNFHGRVFTPDEHTQIQLQDMNGLVSIFGGNSARSQTLINYLTGSADQTRTIIADLMHWQGIETSIATSMRHIAVRANPLTDLKDLQYIQSIDNTLYQRMLPLVTSLPNAFFNPLTAPEPVLQSLLRPEVATELIRQRNNNQLTASSFMALSRMGDEDESVIFTPGPRFQVWLTVTYGGAVAKQSLIWYIRPENRYPVIWLQ